MNEAGTTPLRRRFTPVLNPRSMRRPDSGSGAYSGVRSHVAARENSHAELRL